mgnify:CR=1 FL=1
MLEEIRDRGEALKVGAAGKVPGTGPRLLDALYQGAGSGAPQRVEGAALAMECKPADTLRKEDLTRLRIEGHADNIGGDEYNRRLSTRRAEVVAREFTARGLPAARIEIRGVGSAMPIADNATEAGRTQNRRVVVLVRGD